MLKLIALIIPLGLDSFAVAAALGATGVQGRDGLRISVLFGVFEAVMPLIGFALGAPVGHAVGNAGNYAATAILVALGLWMLRGDDEPDRVAKLTRPTGMWALMLGFSISIDELVIGFTLGLLRGPVLVVAPVVGVQAAVFSQLGLRLGARLGERVRHDAQRLAGLALMLLGIALLIERLA
jgi:putative Mn2+ efflux pump MntP